MSRASKSGLAADIERKLEHQYDATEARGTPDAVRMWILATLGEKSDVVKNDFKSIAAYLKDGTVLCRFINVLLKSDGKAPVGFQKKCASPFVAMTNIENFNKGATDYGLGKEALFQTTDLYESRKGPFLNVINCLHSLGSLANGKDFEVKYTGVDEPTLDRD
ncbi:transgelin-2 [Patella vulgata]|uniref:transgelin-2 n=1 Tax=Patella vulgata TaxID=6465 RepID=UPI002180686C|nr:transgelin-2 [Patella vulgata]